MAYWDETTATPTVTTKKRIWRVEIFGDLDGDFQFVAHLQKIKVEDGVELPPQDLGTVSINYAQAAADLAIEPSITKVRNGCRALVRALRTSDQVAQ